MIRFALYIHNHQPAGNFDDVFEFAYQHSYKPFLESLLKHPKIKFGIHNSGTLLEWTIKNHPEFIDLLKQTIASKQAEILSSAYGEPILSFIPAKDAIEQIKYYNDLLYKQLGYLPKGLWLTERIWEPNIIGTLLDAGIEYILLDDTHFLYAGLQHDDLRSYFVTEDDGRVLKVFPISMKLRYLIPFHPISETMDFLNTESKKDDRTLRILGDDGEKFGVWPGTHDWVYNKGWLENFLQRLEDEPWIDMVFLKDIALENPAGRIYFPTSSYEEMGEWALPPDRGHEYDEVRNLIDPKYYSLLHGGYFKNFLQKYSEANQMHKRMLYVSHRKPKNRKAKLALWRGQCSCAYWHGVFGGLYLPHLREAVYRNLIDADNANPDQTMHLEDFDADGRDEIVFSNNEFFAVLDPITGSFIELDDRRRGMNICNYLCRRKEKYHRHIPEHAANNDVRSIHESFRSKEANLHESLIYDTDIRRFGLDRQLTAIPTVDDYKHNHYPGQIIDYAQFKFEDPECCALSFSGTMRKRIRINKSNKKTFDIVYTSSDMLIGVEFSIGIFGANLKLNTGQALTELIFLENIAVFSIQGDGLAPIEFSMNHPCTILSYPIETVSSSESGYEKNFQGCSIMLILPKGVETTISVCL